MNPDTKRFEHLSEEQATTSPYDSWKQFGIGEILEVKGVKMRVRKVTNKDLVLRPVRDEESGAKQL